MSKIYYKGCQIYAKLKSTRFMVCTNYYNIVIKLKSSKKAYKWKYYQEALPLIQNF